MDFSGWFSATFTVLAVINPVVTAAMLMQVTDAQSSAKRVRTASSACLIILLILLLAAIGGQYLLHAFGITMDAFRMIGGVIVAYLGFLMLSGRMAQQRQGADGARGIGTVVQFAASPGTIAVVITLASVHDGPFGFPVTALIAVVLAVAWTWLLTVIMMMFVSHINNKVQNISNQFMGLIITTMGLQFFLEGFKHFMNS